MQKRLTIFKSWILIGGIVLAPIVMLALPASFFDQGDSICLSVVLFDTECPGCGMTRACQHLIHGEVNTALDYNKLSLIVLPLLAWVGVSEVRRNWKNLKNNRTKTEG